MEKNDLQEILQYQKRGMNESGGRQNKEKLGKGRLRSSSRRGINSINKSTTQ